MSEIINWLHGNLECDRFKWCPLSQQVFFTWAEILSSLHPVRSIYNVHEGARAFLEPKKHVMIHVHVLLATTEAIFTEVIQYTYCSIIN